MDKEVQNLFRALRRPRLPQCSALDNLPGDIRGWQNWLLRDGRIFFTDGGPAGLTVFEFLPVVRGMFQVAILVDGGGAHLHDALAVILEVAAGSPRVAGLVLVFVVKAKGIMAELVEDIPRLGVVCVYHGKVTVILPQAGIAATAFSEA